MEIDNTWGDLHQVDAWSKASQTVGFLPRAETYSFDLGGMTGEDIEQYTKCFRQVGSNVINSMGVLPAEVVEKLENTARELLRLRLRLRMVLKLSRNRRAQHVKTMLRPSLRVLSSNSEVFKFWPSASLEHLRLKMIPTVFDSGEYIFHTGEPIFSGVALITTGVAEETTVPSNKTQRRTGTLLRKTYSKEEFIIGAVGQLTGEKHINSIVTRTVCDAWIMKSTDIIKSFNDLDENVKNQILDSVFSYKCLEMRKQISVSTQTFRKSSPIFASASDDELHDVIHKLVPKIIRKGLPVFTYGSPSCNCYFIYRGSVAMISRFLSVGGRDPVAEKKEPPTVTKNTMIGELDMLFKEKRRVTAIAKSHCYLYMLDMSALSCNPSLLSKTAKAAAERRKDVMDRGSIEESLSNCLLFQFLETPIRNQVSELFQPKVISAGEILASSSQRVDAIIIIARGGVRIRHVDIFKYPGEDIVYPGECIGYTGLLQQRWKNPIFTTTLVECWMLYFSDFIPWLREKKLLARVRDYSAELYRKQESKTPRTESLLIDAVDTFIAPRPKLWPGSKWGQVSAVMNEANQQLRTLLSPSECLLDANIVQKGVGLWRISPLSQRQCIQMSTPGGLVDKVPLVHTRSFVNAPPSKNEIHTTLQRSLITKTCKMSVKMSHLHAKAQTAIGLRVQRLYNQMHSNTRSLRDQCNLDSNLSDERSGGHVEGTRRLLPDAEIQKLATNKRRKPKRASSAAFTGPIPPTRSSAGQRPHSAKIDSLFKIQTSEWKKFRKWCWQNEGAAPMQPIPPPTCSIMLDGTAAVM